MEVHNEAQSIWTRKTNNFNLPQQYTITHGVFNKMENSRIQKAFLASHSSIDVIVSHSQPLLGARAQNFHVQSIATSYQLHRFSCSNLFVSKHGKDCSNGSIHRSSYYCRRQSWISPEETLIHKGNSQVTRLDSHIS